MTYEAIYRGDGAVREATFPPPPPWRQVPAPVVGADGRGLFQPPDGLVETVNAALRLRRPLLLTGLPGSGKSTVVDAVAHELALGPVLRWHVTSRSTLGDALYRYDALGRIHAHQLAASNRGPAAENIGAFVQLGPLGTALVPGNRPRALIIDEIDKSDLDLPSDLLDVLERGEFDIPELTQLDREEVAVRRWDGDEPYVVRDGHVRCREFPFIVMTSNGERDFPAPFLRRCIRFTMPDPSVESLTRVVTAHLSSQHAETALAAELIDAFVKRVKSGETLAVDQLLNTIFLLTNDVSTDAAARKRLVDLLMRELSYE